MRASKLRSGSGTSVIASAVTISASLRYRLTLNTAIGPPAACPGQLARLGRQQEGLEPLQTVDVVEDRGAELLGDGVAVRSRRRGCLTQCARGVPSRQRGLDAREVGRVVGRVELVAQRKEPGGKDRVADMEFGEVAARFECLPLEDGPAKLEQPKRLRRRVGLGRRQVSARPRRWPGTRTG